MGGYGGLGQQADALSELPIQVPFAAVTCDHSGVRETRQGMGDRRALGTHQPGQEMMGERQGQADAGRGHIKADVHEVHCEGQAYRRWADGRPDGGSVITGRIAEQTGIDQVRTHVQNRQGLRARAGADP